MNASPRLSGDHVGEDGAVPAIEEAEAIRSTVSGAAMAPQPRKSEVKRRSRMRTMLPAGESRRQSADPIRGAETEQYRRLTTNVRGA